MGASTCGARLAMSDKPEITCMFADLFYKTQLPEVAVKNSEMCARALDVFAKVKRTVEWDCDTFATLDSEYNALEDPLFADLITTTRQKVLEFALVYGVGEHADILCKDAWLNVANPGASQEMHIHPAMHFSAVYYVETPENCGDLIFRSHESLSDMFPLPTDSEQPANYKTYWHKALAGSLIIFRSNLAHMVAKNKSNSSRVSVAMNFVVERKAA